MNGKCMEYAPILIPTLNRSEHLKRCIISLQQNKLAEYSELIISVDYPPEQKYEEGYCQVCSFLDKGIEGFRRVLIIKHKKNIGAYNNYIFLKNYIKEKYDRFIFAEDDNEFSPNFLDYINTGLNIFEADEKIIAVCSNGITPIKYYDGNIALTKNFSAQGYGSWCNKENRIAENINRENFENMARDGRFLLKLFQNDKTLFYALKSAILCEEKLYQRPERKIPYVDMTVKIYMQTQELYVVAPILSTSRNFGYDGTGVNCPKTKGNNKGAMIDHSKEFEYSFPDAMPIHSFKNKLDLESWLRFIIGKMKIYLYFRLQKKNENNKRHKRC